MANWGNSEAKECLLIAEDEVNQRFSGTMNIAGIVHVTQMLTAL